jgi:glycosidase
MRCSATSLPRAQALLRDDVLYSSFHPMNFLGNHDTPRVASRLTHAAHGHLALAFLFACRGMPSLYYGDELGLKGDKQADAGWGGDAGMRQVLLLERQEESCVAAAGGIPRHPQHRSEGEPSEDLREWGPLLMR